MNADSRMCLHGFDLGRRAHAAAMAAALLAVAGLLCGSLALAAVRPPTAATPLTIVVHCAPFPSADSAAVAEESVRWTDGDLSDDDACTESYAAVELRDMLRRLGAPAARRVVIRPGDSLPETGDVIVVGNPRSQPLVRELLGAALPDPVSRDAFRLRAVRRAGRTIWVVAGTGRSGTLYGSYAFLERLGLRFYGPADSETVWPRGPLVLPARLDAASSPAFEERGFWAWEARGDEAFFRWMARWRMNLWSAAEPRAALLRKLAIRLAGGGHSIQSDYLDPRAPDGASGRSYFETHPEWFGLHDGKRSSRIMGEAGDNFCTSNSAAVAELARNLVHSLRGGPLAHADLVNVWPLDGGRWCECDSCKALGGPSDRAVALVRRIAAAVSEAHRRGELDREVTCSAAAYLETLSPPQHPAGVAADDSTMRVTFFPYYRCYAHALLDPGCRELNRRIATEWQGWTQTPGRAYVGPVGICEYYNVSWFKTLPLLFPHVMARDIAGDRAAGARWFSYMHAPTAKWGTWRPNHLVLSEALWTPGVNVDSLLADYCARAYPSAPVDMRYFLRQLEIASANVFALELSVGGVFAMTGNPGGRLTVRKLPVFPYAHLPATAPAAAREVNDAPAWREIVTAMAAARRSLDRARAAARDAGERWRLDEDARRFAYGDLTFGLYDRMFDLALAERGAGDIDTRRALAEADSIAHRLEAIHDLVQVAGEHANASDGLAASHVGAALQWFHTRFDVAPR